MGEVWIRMFPGGFVRLPILDHAAREPIYGVEMMAEVLDDRTPGPGTRPPRSGRRPETWTDPDE